VSECKPLLMGTRLFFAPNAQNNVGVLDTDSSVFTTYATADDTTGRGSHSFTFQLNLSRV